MWEPHTHDAGPTDADEEGRPEGVLFEQAVQRGANETPVLEPLAGVDAVCPVAPATRMWVQSPRAVIDNLIVGHEAPAAAFAHSRSINVSGICVGVRDMVMALRRVAGDAVADRVKWQLEPATDKIVATWAANFAPKLGPALGMKADTDFETIIRAYIADERIRVV